MKKNLKWQGYLNHYHITQDCTKMADSIKPPCTATDKGCIIPPKGFIEKVIDKIKSINEYMKPFNDSLMNEHKTR